MRDIIVQKIVDNRTVSVGTTLYSDIISQFFESGRIVGTINVGGGTESITLTVQTNVSRAAWDAGIVDDGMDMDFLDPSTTAPNCVLTKTFTADATTKVIAILDGPSQYTRIKLVNAGDSDAIADLWFIGG